jgi:hypothetical protein
MFMTMRHRASLRTIATGSVLGLTAGTVAVLGTAGTAHAVPIGFDCTVPVLGTQTFTTDLSTNAPAQLPSGAKTTPTVTAQLTVPASLADLMRGALGIDEIAGQIVSQTTVKGAVVPTTLAIPRVDIGDTGDAVLTATGPLGPITGGDPGPVPLQAGSQAVTMTLFDLAGDPAGTVFEIPCTPAAGQTLTFDTISVVKASSRTVAKASYAAKKDKVTGQATVRSTAAPTGKVKFVLKKGSKKVAAKTAAVRNGKAAVAFSRIRKSGKYTLVASYLGSARTKPSTDRAGFRVR